MTTQENNDVANTSILIYLFVTTATLRNSCKTRNTVTIIQWSVQGETMFV